MTPSALDIFKDFYNLLVKQKLHIFPVRDISHILVYIMEHLSIWIKTVIRSFSISSPNFGLF